MYINEKRINKLLIEHNLAHHYQLEDMDVINQLARRLMTMTMKSNRLFWSWRTASISIYIYTE